MRPTAAQIAAIFGCSEKNVRRQFAKNSEQLAAMQNRAQATGRRVNGYTAAQLSDSAEYCREMATK